MKTVPAPLDETKKFYEETGKEIKQKTDVSHKRSSQLEEKEKRKRVFTGDSNVIFNEKIYQAYPNISDYEQIKKRKFCFNTQFEFFFINLIVLPGLAKEKHELHAKAIQETQLIGLEGYITETLEGKVNLEKIKEVRRAIRRRYANRKNFKKIFSAWDEDSQGSLSIKNVYNMVKKMGLNINAYEAQVLVASADRNGNGHLSLDEFLDLIFNDNTMLNIDLKKIPCNFFLFFKYLSNFLVKEDEEFKQEKSDEVLKYLTHDANESRIKKHQNQIQLVLQNQINAITNYCIELDEKKFGYINKEKFQKLLGKINISENILTNEDRNVLYEQYKDDKNNFNYKNFVSQIKNFTFNVDEAYVKIFYFFLR